MHGCDPGRVSDGSRLALYQTLSIECPSSTFFFFSFFLAGVFCYCSFFFVVSVSFRFVFFCSLVGAFFFFFFFCPADHVPDWQPRILLGIVEARSVNVKKTITTVYFQVNNGVLYFLDYEEIYIMVLSVLVSML